MNLDPMDTLSTLLWADNLRSNSDSAYKAVSAWHKNHQDSPAAHVALLREAKMSDSELNIKAATNVGDAFFAKYSELMSHDAEYVGANIQYLVIKGELPKARKLLNTYKGTSPYLLLAKADLMAATGDIDAAKEALKAAGKRWPDHPAYALFLR